ncbi:MAG: hypothetical protein ACI9KR_000866 [Arcticibacterium sp.]|jgi:hypothetical protein
MIFKTYTNKAKYLMLSIALATSSFMIAQDIKQDTIPKFSISGTVDAYFRSNLNAPNVGDNTMAPGSSFAQLPGFALGMANIITAYEGEKVGFVADLVFGPRGTDAIFNSPMYSATGNVVNQLYMYWNVSEKVTLTMGNFNTFLGYEVISPAANFNYSTSYLFSYGPFSHTGIKADFALGEDLSAMIGVFNPTDLTEYNPTGIYAFGAQLGYKGQYVNLLTDSGAYELDYTGGVSLSDHFYLGLNAAVYDNDGIGFAGVALYPQLNTSDTFALGLRGEYFVESGAYGAIDQIGNGTEDGSVFALTLTASASVGNLILKPEFRIDNASDDSFLNTKFAPQKSLSSFLLAAVYVF